MSEFQKHLDDFDCVDQEDVGRLSDRAGSPSLHMDQEKRMRREIANSNERRRMQSINAGFQSLRTLLPHHEGEKLSKAAILQQTAEYIYTLEQEKTRLLSQNCQLKRIISQQEGDASPNVKKRKHDSGAVTVVPAPISESSDEGIGSMSPEPVGISGLAGATAVAAAEQDCAAELLRRELVDVRMHLDRERRVRLTLEDQIKSLESQMYPERAPLYQHEVAAWPEDPPLEEELYPDLKQDSDLSHPLLHQTIVDKEVPPPRRESQCSSHSSSRLFKDDVEGVPTIQTTTIVPSPLLYSTEPEGLPMVPLPLPMPVPVSASPCPSPVQTTLLDHVSPALETHIPSVLEAASKAEPKVEVERLPSPSSVAEDVSQTRLYLNTSRQNLETIVEAIRHLEGDHLFSDDPSPHRQGVTPATISPTLSTDLSTAPQDHLQERLQGCPEIETQEMPLALTTNSRTHPQHCADTRVVKMKIDPFPYQRAAVQQQQRPGVIVVKQHT